MATDYKIEADDNLTLALEHTAGYGHLSTADLIALAQVNATLYAGEQTAELVKEQHVANLIAFVDSANRASGTNEDGYARLMTAGAQIREGLGL